MGIGWKQIEGAQSGRKEVRLERYGGVTRDHTWRSKIEDHFPSSRTGRMCMHIILCLCYGELSLVLHSNLGTNPFFFFIWARPSGIFSADLLFPRCTFSRRLLFAWTDSRIEVARARAVSKETNTNTIVAPFPSFFLRLCLRKNSFVNITLSHNLNSIQPTPRRVFFLLGSQIENQEPPSHPFRHLIHIL